ncbi:glycine-rich RNA-binding protein 2-like [Durio zibethinus]|uniref:Glycine-rich RNA-binding protein 2-like n=1 Tax=Durio zibethinus TaxID=66656 RepID=A0A6P5ZMF5_DURZI|nr:glycine-rich RNA-binding protein 2-like [Durio zibethinus]
MAMPPSGSGQPASSICSSAVVSAVLLSWWVTKTRLQNGFQEVWNVLSAAFCSAQPLLAVLAQTSLPNPLMTIDFKQEQNVTYKNLPETLSLMSVKLGDKQNITAVNKRGGGGGGHGGGHIGRGRSGGGGRGRGRGNGGGKKSPAGVMNHPRISQSRGSSGGTLNYASLRFLILTFFASSFLV